MPELELLKTPASSQQPTQAQGKKRKQSPNSPSSQTDRDGRELHQQQQQYNQQTSSSQTFQQSTIPELFATTGAHPQPQPQPQLPSHLSQLQTQLPHNSNRNKSSRPSTPPNQIGSTAAYTQLPPPPSLKRHRSSVEPGAEIFQTRTPTVATTTNSANSTMVNFDSKKVIDLTESPPQRSPAAEGTTLGSTTGNLNNIATPRPPTFKSHGGPRKLVVKNLRQSPKTSPEVYYEQTWKSLDAALTAIFNGQRVSTSLEELYRGVENLCRGDKAAPTYEKLKARCDGHVGGKVKNELNERAGRSDDEVVKAVEAAWTTWCDQLTMIRSIFFYLDRSYLLSSPHLPSIWETGLLLFKSHIANDEKIDPKFLRGIFNLFEHDRQNQGEVVNISLLLSSIRMISALGLYTSKFEPKFIQVSKTYFAWVAEQEASSRSLAGYLAECVTQLEKESIRCEKFQLDLSTKREIVSVLEGEMVRNRIAFLTDKASVSELLEKRDKVSLGKLYSLVDRVENAGTHLKPAWETYIVTSGAAIIQDESQEAEVVPRLLDFKSSLDTTLSEAFRNNDILSHSLRESFTSFINARNPKAAHKNNSKSSEMIAKYVDLLLRSGIKALPSSSGKKPDGNGAGPGDEDAILGNQLESALDLFRFIQGKDVFEAFYKKDLARRLLMGRSASADAERSMLAKLKSECGAGFTQNLESMFKDIELSKDAMNSFKTSKIGVDKARGVDLNVNILSMSAWPTYPDVPVVLPQHLAEYMEAFKEFYIGKHKGRKLTFRHALAQCVIKADLPKGKKELVVSAFQAVVLLLFNDLKQGASLSYSELKEASGLPDRELNRTLQSMACGRHRILSKTPKSRDVTVTDTFSVNTTFSDEKFRIKINQIQLKETKEENEETHERVAQDRQYETQAAIIRIMKSRKSIKHLELIQQTIEQTKNRGVLDVGEIKKNIEKLIDKEYMERVEGTDTYRYIS